MSACQQTAVVVKQVSLLLVATAFLTCTQKVGQVNVNIRNESGTVPDSFRSILKIHAYY